MVDCQWERSEIRAQNLSAGRGIARPQSRIPNPKSLVSLGDKFALSSGLMEITYDTGAKVILRAR